MAASISRTKATVLLGSQRPNQVMILRSHLRVVTRMANTPRPTGAAMQLARQHVAVVQLARQYVAAVSADEVEVEDRAEVEGVI
jgi:hypothetical protein